MCVLGNQLSESYLISSSSSKTPSWDSGQNSLFPCARVQYELPNPSFVWGPFHGVPLREVWALVGGTVAGKWQGILKWCLEASFLEGPSCSTFSQNMRFQCPCHVQALAALPKSLMRTPDTVNHDTSCCGFCACEMNFLLIIKCSPTCGKLPFLEPFKSDLMQSPFPHRTEETRSVVVTQQSTLAAWLLQEIIPSEMNFYISYQLTACSWLPNFCPITVMNVCRDGALSQREHIWGFLLPWACVPWNQL